MKIATPLPNTKAGKAQKLENLRLANGRVVHYNHTTYFIRVVTIGKLVIASATTKIGEAGFNLDQDNTAAKDIKKLCENRLYS